MKNPQRVRGTRDLLPDEKVIFRHIEKTMLELSQRYGFLEIETPLLESSDVFHRSLGETSDVVGKETYTFVDRGGDSVTLRPEGTAGVARAFVSEGLAQHLPLKLAYSGPMFRYERPQKGRYRQFYQLGVESLGLENAIADIDCLCLAADFLEKIDLLKICQLEINTLGDQESRLKYKQTLVEYFQKHESSLSADSKVRLLKNPLRILDSKDETDKKISLDAPQMRDSLSDSSRDFFDRVMNGLTKLNISFRHNSHLVRGLDYYCHTVFEFTTQQLGAQGTVLGGGRYDGLIEMMGGPRTPGVGWAAGLDRLAELFDRTQYVDSMIRLAVLPIDQAGLDSTVEIARYLRNAGHRVEYYLTGQLGKRIKKAEASGFQWVVFIGESELNNKTVQLKNLKTGEQSFIKISDLSDWQG